MKHFSAMFALIIFALPIAFAANEPEDSLILYWKKMLINR